MSDLPITWKMSQPSLIYRVSSSIILALFGMQTFAIMLKIGVAIRSREVNGKKSIKRNEKHILKMLIEFF